MSISGVSRATACALAALSLFLVVHPALADYGFLDPYEDGSRAFEEVEIGDGLVVYFHPRSIGEAVVEKDYIVYQFDRAGNLLARKEHWRNHLPERLPESLITENQAVSRIPGEIESARLMFIDPESDVFPIRPAPANPCWVVRSIDEGRLTITVIDAVEGRVLGTGVPPPYTAFSLTGPWYFGPCDGAWDSWSQNAETWFNTMGYSTEHVVWPTEEQVRGHVQSTETAMFYELAHGGSQGFSSGCVDGQTAEDTYSYEVQLWILPYEQMPFAFIGSCDGMCSTAPNSFAYEFRKGLANSAVVGYCGMSTPACDRCWGFSIDWQDALFSYMNQGYTVKDAFDQANADFPSCAINECMRFSGDEAFAAVPVVSRGIPVWARLTAGPLGNAGSGRGVAWADYDNDGDLDLYLANYSGGKPNRLMRNDGGGVFVSVANDPLGDLGAGMGVAWGDYDNDGDPDLYLVNYASANRLFRNDGGDTFTDVTAGPLGDSGLGRSAAWADYDNDGDLDLYVVNSTSANKLFRNDGGSFSDATTGPLGDAGNGMGAAWGDYDGDGDLDLYLANEGSANVLLENEGGGTFVDATAGPLGDTGPGAGVAWGDYDNDGDLDLYLSNFDAPNRLFRNDGGAFTDATAGALGDEGRGRSVAWGDYDNDGDLDLYVANETGVNRLLANEGAGFVDVTSGPLADTRQSMGAAWGDYDGDGDLDLYLATALGGNSLVRNDLATGNHWLHVNLVGMVSNRSGIGARVRVVSGRGSQIREVSGGSGFLSQDSFTAEFGLGSETAATLVEVRWPSGMVDTQSNVPADQLITIVEGETTDIAEANPAIGELKLDPNVPEPFNPWTVIHYDLPGSAPVILSVYDVSGRRVRTLIGGSVQRAGHHTHPWDGRDDRGREVASGVYFCRLEVAGKAMTERMVLVK